jgi:peptidoglycan/LPS O-acetylase OafA/YrhL
VARSDRLASLDLLRAVAVVLVMGRHMDAVPPEAGAATRAIAGCWRQGGWVGVDLFFVLSGFLIAGLLFREYQRHGEIHLGRFFIRRGLKIYPPFFALLAVTLAVRLGRGHPLRASQVLGETLFLQNYAGALWSHTWSLAVEEHFYLLLPLTLALMVRARRGQTDPFTSLARLFLALAAALLAVRLANAACYDHYGHRSHLFRTHLRIDSLAFGVLCSYYYHFHREWFTRLVAPRRKRLAAAGAMLLLPAFVLPLETTPFVYTVGLTLFYCGSGLLLSSMVAGEPRGRLLGWAAALGAYSYSIYLWHLPWKDWGVPLVERSFGFELPYLVSTALYLAGSAVVGIGMAALVEYPVLRLRDRFFPTRSDGMAAERDISGEPGRTAAGWHAARAA